MRAVAHMIPVGKTTLTLPLEANIIAFNEPGVVPLISIRLGVMDENGPKGDRTFIVTPFGKSNEEPNGKKYTLIGVVAAGDRAYAVVEEKNFPTTGKPPSAKSSGAKAAEKEKK